MPQILHRFGVLSYCPALVARIQDKLPLEPGGSWEVQIRGCSIWATELIRRQIAQQHQSADKVNAVLIDFLLYDWAKELEFDKGKVLVFSAITAAPMTKTSCLHIPCSYDFRLFHLCLLRSFASVR